MIESENTWFPKSLAGACFVERRAQRTRDFGAKTLNCVKSAIAFDSESGVDHLLKFPLDQLAQPVARLCKAEKQSSGCGDDLVSSRSDVLGDQSNDGSADFSGWEILRLAKIRKWNRSAISNADLGLTARIEEISLGDRIASCSGDVERVFNHSYHSLSSSFLAAKYGDAASNLIAVDWSFKLQDAKDHFDNRLNLMLPTVG